MKTIVLHSTKSRMFRYRDGKIFIDGSFYQNYYGNERKVFQVPEQAKTISVTIGRFTSNEFDISKLQEYNINVFSKISNFWLFLSYLIYLLAMFSLFFDLPKIYRYIGILGLIPIILMFFIEFFKRKGLVVLKSKE
ncbi:hypothetical protein [Capnocytophaga cynodegmi]|uniref:Uncharacterized protein n=1 Tax=Capnocytophaga cynodegmi TaxID=28189 RepID=A0A0B7HD05_9FLAO|nr:hypothetical protein [Capnocytophaga cynodegmi]CEN35458.1 hypothetical protein CCYN2B_260019 [Capnocytophaga cynodegmi]